MLTCIIALTTITLLSGAALAAAITLPPPLPPQPVTDSYFGTTITDPYRYFENEKDTAVTDWMKAQWRYTAALFEPAALK